MLVSSIYKTKQKTIFLPEKLDLLNIPSMYKQSILCITRMQAVLHAHMTIFHCRLDRVMEDVLKHYVYKELISSCIASVQFVFECFSLIKTCKRLMTS